MPAPSKKHASDSSEQRLAEQEILATLEAEWSVQFAGRPDIGRRVDLDGYVDGPEPILLEVWAHQGPAKGAQPGKVMKDFCKLLLVERLLDRPCRKVFAVADPAAVAFLRNSWQGQFAEEFGIEVVVLTISNQTRRRVQEAQQRQFR